MRGYHIIISVQRKIELSTSHPHPTDVFLPGNLFQHLPAHQPKATKRKTALYNYNNKDYRLGPIRLDWVDFETMSTSSSAGKAREQNKGTAAASFVPNSRTKSGSTNLPEGVVHIFRDAAKAQTAEEIEADPQASSGKVTVGAADGVTLAILAVPSWMTPSDFLTFVAPAGDGISHLRMIRDIAPNRSIVVIRFPKPADVAEFIEAYNGKPFNSMEPEICHVVRVLSIQIESEDLISQAIARLGSAPSSIYEIPTCPVCLERMDSAVTGLITVPCSHTFHCMCLSKWGDSRCPVCRYSQTLLSSHPAPSTASSARRIPFSPSSQSPSLSRCSSCASTNNLWICLICGNIGCGRYGRGHAHAHYEATTHLYALELETQRVWDYAGDGYVHRLIQNRADGKLVELPSAAASVGGSREGGGGGPSAADALSAEKIEAIGIEYSYLLTSQLDSQREYYEEQQADLKNRVGELSSLVESLSREFEKQRTEAREAQATAARERDEQLSEAMRDKARAEGRSEKMAELARKLDKELKEERAVSAGLMKNMGKMKERQQEAEREKRASDEKIRDLEDQLRDVMFFLEAKTKIEQGGGVESEAAGGSVELPPPSAKKKTSKKR
ncbi:hypothetical protein BD626DRAFT_121481 [Schizophyllum amplum]|uniref:BRCA1-associated protein 2-domain-containing protein n=1 Tax=Schizophyllum amplum TaxID=97359 RepID=A0A550C7G6_9AGAR|nr:hypothetical protein BD626DRAFT_121481 [Auriculariopsis ampla]